MTTQREDPARFLLRCKLCGKTVRQDLLRVFKEGEPTTFLGHYMPAEIYDEHFIDPVTREPTQPGACKCKCGRFYSSVQQITGRTVPGTRCGARCRNSKGPTCECSCGGTNHGSGHHHA